METEPGGNQDTQNPRVTCNHCNKELSNKTSLKGHVLRKHTFEKTYSCNCGSQFYSSGELRIHKRRKCLLRTPEPLPCEHDDSVSKARVARTWAGCGKTFTSKAGVSCHVKRCHELDKPHTCGYCGKRFAMHRGLANHVQQHTGEKPFQNGIECGLCFGQLERLRIHVRQSHTGERPHKCEVCGKGFASSSVRAAHRRAHAPSEFRALNCSLLGCGKTFPTASGLRAHAQRCHDDNKRYSCECCRKKFATATQLAGHMRTHTRERPFPCGKCPSRFSSLTGLSAHLKRLHSNLRPFACQICPKAFMASQDFNRHLETHKRKQDRQHASCPQCGKQVLHQILGQHMATHNEPRIQCPYCDKRFKYKRLLSQHLVVHTGEKAAICGVCGRGFGLSENLRRHMKIMHR